MRARLGWKGRVPAGVRQLRLPHGGALGDGGGGCGGVMTLGGRPSSAEASGSSSVVATPGKRTPGKLALGTRCGTQSEDLSTCVRCKRKLPEDVKLLDDPKSSANAIKNLTPAQRDQIVSECVYHHWSPVDLGKKWGCSPDTIRQWVKKAGKVLPIMGAHAHMTGFMEKADYNFTHRIEKLSFGDKHAGIIQPLEGDEKITDISRSCTAALI